MRRITGLVGAGALLMSMVILSGLVSEVGAQDASPVPEAFEIAPGVTAEAVAFAPGQEVPALYRLHFAPDVIYPFFEDPSLGLVYVESGTLTLRVDMPVMVGQVGAADAAGEQVAADTEFTVTAGDYFVLPPFATGEVRNDGPEAATVSVAGIVPAGSAPAPGGTPTP